jgi:hypothetical protein
MQPRLWCVTVEGENLYISRRDIDVVLKEKSVDLLGPMLNSQSTSRNDGPK